ncbi:hypothetical protein FKM82_008109 [Ascaphus truei]
MLVLGTVLRKSLFIVIGVAAYPNQEYLKTFGGMELQNQTRIHSTSMNCLPQKMSSSPPNETSNKYHVPISIGDGLYVFGLIGIFIVLKSLLTIITMVENKPRDSEYVLSKCKPPVPNKTPVQTMESVTITTPNSPASCQKLNTSISSPALHSGNTCYPKPNLDKGGQECGGRCPEGSTKSPV